MPFGASSPRFPVSVLRRRALSERVVALRLRQNASPGSEFSWLPGQYVELAAATAPQVSHYYSIASAPDPHARGEFDLVISLSAAEELLRELEPGRTLWVSPAQGAFVWESMQAPALLVGIGTGIAPMRAMLQAALGGATERVTVLFGARTELDLLFREEFDEYAASDARFRFEPVLSRPGAGWRGSVGRVQGQLPRVVSELQPARVYVCGTTTMVRDTVALLHELGVPAPNVRAESHGE